MFEFDPFRLVILVFFSSILPGALLFLGVLKNAKYKTVEKILIGGGIGLTIVPLFLFLEYIILGISFSPTLVYVNIILFYIIAAIVFWKTEAWKTEIEKDRISIVTSFVLLILVVSSFWIRFQTYGPIYQELDPYYYLYAPYQLITLGELPLDDQTAWYPEVEVSHRNAPLLSYMEAMWFELYGGDYSPYLLSTIGSLYPPIVTAFTMVFFYLMLTTRYNRTSSLVAAFVISLIPMFLIKTIAGVSEVQPYGFFGLSIFFAFYAALIKEQKIVFAALATYGFFMTLFGAAVSMVVVAVFMFAYVVYILILFFLDREMKQFIITNTMIAISIAILLHVKSFYQFGELSFSVSAFALPFSVLLFSLALYGVKTKIENKESRMYAGIGLLMLSFLMVLFTPIGSSISSSLKGLLSIAQYNVPLDRTIAEQGTTGTALQSELGFIGLVPSGIFSIVFSIFSVPINTLFAFGIVVFNKLFSTTLEWTNKDPAVFHLIILAFICFFVYRLWKQKNEEELNTIFLVACFLFPIAFVGLLKAKYTLFFGIGAGLALGAVLGEIEILIRNKKHAWELMLLAGFVIIILQFLTAPAIGKALLFNSLSVRFQDNPIAVQDKLSDVCSYLQTYGTREDEICEAAADPIGYASGGINNQYNENLCVISLIDDPFSQATEDEKIAVSYRCSRIAPYWIETMEWIKENTEEDGRIISWWDYGHWLNFFGMRNAVLRNEHASLDMIGAVAYLYLMGTPEELIQYMRSHDAEYVLFDSELIYGSGQFGMKYGALNYLGCAYINETNVNNPTASSECEFNNLWERIVVLNDTESCLISMNEGTFGVTAYKLTFSGMEKAYCIGTTTLTTGETISMLYYLNDTNVELEAKKGFLMFPISYKDYTIYTIVYTKDEVWIEDGNVTSSWEDKEGNFYDSNLYNGWMLEEIEGFEKVFESEGGEVKIFKIKD